jgi:hypothetical protein
MISFVQTNMYATVVALGPHNFAKVGKLGKPMVIGVVDMKAADQGQQVADMQSQLLQYATATPEHTDTYVYGILDGRQWHKFLSQFNVTDMPQIFMYDLVSKTYWQNGATHVTELITAIEQGTLVAQTAGPKTFEKYANAVYTWLVEYKPWSIVIVMLVVTAIALGITVLVAPPMEKDTGSGTPSTNTNTTQTKKDTTTPVEDTNPKKETKKDK